MSVSSIASHLYEPILGSLLKDLREEVLRQVFLPEMCTQERTIRLLDCCCGAGGLLKMASAKETVSLLAALDMDRHMLQRTKTHLPHVMSIQGDASCIPFISKTFHVSTICMALHTMPLITAQKVMHELLRVSKRVIIADYCLGERNIFIPAVYMAHSVEWLVGGEHYANYKKFMQNGALQGFVHEFEKEYAELFSKFLCTTWHATVLGGAGLVCEITTI